VKALLVIATVIDLALAALLIAVSGFIFGGGPEGLRGAMGSAVAWSTAFLACLAAPTASFMLHRRGKDGWGVLVGWLPPVAALVLAVAPINPY